LVDQQRLVAEPTQGQQVFSTFPITPLSADNPDPSAP
jgi:hypothetical protein